MFIVIGVRDAGDAFIAKKEAGHCGWFVTEHEAEDLAKALKQAVRGSFSDGHRYYVVEPVSEAVVETLPTYHIKRIK